MVGILDPIVRKQGDALKSQSWYRSQISNLTDKITAGRVLRSGKMNQQPSAGRLNMFIYDPKLKKTLPYYDTFPLVLPLEDYNDGFLGLNFHYLPIPLRMRLLDKVVDFSNNTKFDKTTRLNVSYNALRRSKIIRPTIKRYLAGRVKSRFRRIDADEFTVATLLPVARFKKGSQAEVYRDSRKML